MKKLALLLFFAVSLTGCSLGDDEETDNVGYELAVVNSIDVPEYFEQGETYELKVTYTLPSACHSQINPSSLDVRKGGSSPEDRTKIYIGAITTYNINQENCAQEDTSVVLEKEESFSINIAIGEEYTFYLWTGQDTNGDAEWQSISVPVGAPEESN